eukprot:COSAG01_NODE_15508_length_1329_cov_1.181301_3_plen_89_part_00
MKLQLNHSGYMTKLGAIRKNWKRRWFSLDGEGEGVLVYYADEANGGKTKQGVLDAPPPLYQPPPPSVNLDLAPPAPPRSHPLLIGAGC